MPETIHIDQLLTNFATRFAQEFNVAEFIAPGFRVNRTSDKYAVYRKDNLRVYDAKVKGREKAKEVDYSVTTATYACEKYKLAAFLLDEDRDNADKPINAEQDKARHLKEAITLAREYRVYQIAGNASVVTQTGNASNKFNTSSGDPIKDFLNAMATIWSNGRKKANRIVVPMDVGIQMVKLDAWKDYFKYTSAEKIFDLVGGLRNLGLEPMMAGAAGLSTNKGGSSDPNNLEQIWGDSVLMFYCEPTPTTQTRTFMSSPFTAMNEVWRLRDEEAEGTKFIIKDQVDELLVDATLAYLLTDCL